MLAGAAVLLPLMLFCILLTDILASRKFFTMPMVSNMLNSVFVLVFLFAFRERMGLASAMFGLLAAWGFQAVLLAYMMRSSFGWNFTSVGGLPERRVLKNMLYSQVGNATTFFASVFPLALLSGMGHGVVSALNYGRQAAELPNMLVTNQVSSVLGIKLNELQAKKDEMGTARVFSDTVRHMVFLV
ncbi:MAG TPA: lipid II flippase MurJ, partial [Elusimicrobiales bacterium]|nr:lipid II flippase MurJ [Elusimicrobiales bacterium]